MIYVKQTLEIHYQILEARVTSALSIAHAFFVNEEIPQKWLQMRVLHVDKDSSKLPGITEVGKLVFNGDNEEFDHPPRIYKETGRYIWYNRRKCILVLNGEADNSRFVMTEDDHRFISERLPALLGLSPLLLRIH